MLSNKRGKCAHFLVCLSFGVSGALMVSVRVGRMPRGLHHEGHEGHEGIRNKNMSLVPGFAVFSDGFSYLVAFRIPFFVSFVVSRFYYSLEILVVQTS